MHLRVGSISSSTVISPVPLATKLSVMIVSIAVAAKLEAGGEEPGDRPAVFGSRDSSASTESTLWSRRKAGIGSPSKDSCAGREPRLLRWRRCDRKTRRRQSLVPLLVWQRPPSLNGRKFSSDFGGL